MWQSNGSDRCLGSLFLLTNHNQAMWLTSTHLALCTPSLAIARSAHGDSGHAGHKVLSMSKGQGQAQAHAHQHTTPCSITVYMAT